MKNKNTKSASLLAIKNRLDQAETARLCRMATPSRLAMRRRPETGLGHRQDFALDADRILHSRAYTRYIDKTQVFYMVDNDHITHRVLHVQLVAKIARTIGRFLALNEDLIEAIALGHDIGHPPFGHDGEHQLARLCVANGLPPFQHNVQSVQFLERLERKGQGWNLTLQVLDGILCHDGEVHDQGLGPDRAKDFVVFDRQLAAKADDPGLNLLPMTLEGCLVRLADTIAYIGRDVEDAIELGMISRHELPAGCRNVLGDSNGKIVYRLVEDLITSSIGPEGFGPAADRVGFSREIAESLRALKKFNYERIYMNPVIKRGFEKIKICYEVLFNTYLEHLAALRRDSAIFREFLDYMEPYYQLDNPPALVVRDFIAGMTDDYFLSQAARHGCRVPEKV